MSISKGRDKDVVQWNASSIIKKNEIMSFAAKWMDPEIIILSEGSQKEKA